jgi:phosphoglycerate dehydrogenase-like enzyme
VAEALGRADFVVVAVPRTSGTIRLIDAAALTALKPGALFVNLSRGGVVDDRALAEALQSGQLRGACLDVFEEEPLPADSPFWDLENVIVTPHVAGFVEGWQQAVAQLFCDNLERWLQGAALLNVVDGSQGY